MKENITALDVIKTTALVLSAIAIFMATPIAMTIAIAAFIIYRTERGHRSMLRYRGTDSHYLCCEYKSTKPTKERKKVKMNEEIVNYLSITLLAMFAVASLVVQPVYKIFVKYVISPIVYMIYILYVGISTAIERSAVTEAAPQQGGIIIKFNDTSAQKAA